MFPLIPLPNKEATNESLVNEDEALEFPLIPLPNKEATWINVNKDNPQETWKFPLIPLPNKEATESQLIPTLLSSQSFH